MGNPFKRKITSEYLYDEISYLNKINDELYFSNSSILSTINKSLRQGNRDDMNSRLYQRLCNIGWYTINSRIQQIESEVDELTSRNNRLLAMKVKPKKFHNIKDFKKWKELATMLNRISKSSFMVKNLNLTKKLNKFIKQDKLASDCFMDYMIEKYRDALVDFCSISVEFSINLNNILESIIFKSSYPNIKESVDELILKGDDMSTSSTDDMDKTVVLDFDGVIHNMNNGWQNGKIYGKPVDGIKEAIEEIINANYIVVIVSARSATYKGIESMKKWLKENEIPYHSISNTKPPAHCYVDDRAIVFDGKSDTLLAKIKKLKAWWE